MVVGVCQIKLNIPDVHSLKEKRHVVKGVISRIRNDFNASVAEVADNDLWQSASIGISVVGNDRGFVNSVLDKIVDLMESQGSCVVVGHEIEIVNY